VAHDHVHYATPFDVGVCDASLVSPDRLGLICNWPIDLHHLQIIPDNIVLYSPWAVSVVRPLQAQSSPAHTMDRYLPQRLQEEAAAASSAREAREAAAAAAKPEKNQSALRMSSPTVSSPRLSFLNESQGPAVVSVPMPLTSQPYVIPMPTSVKPNGQQASTLNDDRKAGSGGHEHSKGFKHPIESTADIGQGDSVGQIEQGLDLLNLSNLNSEEDDLEAPSSFCCPITTVSHLCPVCLCIASSLQ